MRLPEASARLMARRLLAWYRGAARDLPWRRTRDPYRVWVSEIMLQQTTVRVVIPYFERFVAAFPTVRALARARPDDVLALWSGLGYYRRARNLHQAARLVVERHAGRFPRQLTEALALPGIGRYTAGAILSIACGERLPVVDGNVARVLSRLYLVRGKDAARTRRLWSLAGALVATCREPGSLNQALMELGATVCSPAAPDCPACPVRRVCRARAAGVADRFPAARRATRRPVKVRDDVAVVWRGGRCLLRRRSAGSLMPGMWELPTRRRTGVGDGLRLAWEEPVATVRHSITWRRLQVRVRPAHLLAEPPAKRYRWFRPGDLARLPTSSLARKILAAAPAPRGRAAPRSAPRGRGAGPRKPPPPPV